MNRTISRLKKKMNHFLGLETFSVSRKDLQHIINNYEQALKANESKLAKDVIVIVGYYKLSDRDRLNMINILCSK